MRKFIAILIVVLSGCVTSKQGLPPPADRLTVVGTWDRQDKQETFESDGRYCEFSEAIESLGSWEYQDGYITVQSTSSPSEFRAVFSSSNDELYMGYICPHCLNGIAGAWYRRELPQKHCSAH